MIKNLLRRGLPAPALDAVYPSSPPPSGTPPTQPPRAGLYFTERVPVRSAAGTPDAAALGVPMPLFEAIDRIPGAEEHWAGYERDMYKHWNKGLNGTDGSTPARKGS